MSKRETAEEVYNEGRQVHQAAGHSGGFDTCTDPQCVNFRARASSIAQRRGFRK